MTKKKKPLQILCDTCIHGKKSIRHEPKFTYSFSQQDNFKQYVTRLYYFCNKNDRYVFKARLRYNCKDYQNRSLLDFAH